MILIYKYYELSGDCKVHGYSVKKKNEKKYFIDGA